MFLFHPSNFLKKSYYVIPFGIIFISNILITQLQGFEYIGQLAIYIAGSSFLAIVMGMRWDVEILIGPQEHCLKNFYWGTFCSVTIFAVMLIPFLFLKYNPVIFGFPYFELLVSGLLIALIELLLCIFLKRNKVLSYLLFRSLPYLVLLILSTLDLSPMIAWLWSLSATFLLLVALQMHFISEALLKTSSNALNIFSQIKIKTIPTLSAMISNSIILFWLLYIQATHDSSVVGIWVNAYRIFGLPIALAGAALMPYILNQFGSIESNNQKIILMARFNFFLLIILCAALIYIAIFGKQTFIFLTDSKDLIDKSILFIAAMIAFVQYSLQFWKDLFQSIRKDMIFLQIILLQVILGIFCYFYQSTIPLNLIFIQILLIASFSYFILLLTILRLNRIYR